MPRTKYTTEQKRQLKELRTLLARERKYVPMGQGDSVNSHLVMRAIYYDIDKVKKDPEYRSRRISHY